MSLIMKVNSRHTFIINASFSTKNCNIQLNVASALIIITFWATFVGFTFLLSSSSGLKWEVTVNTCWRCRVPPARWCLSAGQSCNPRRPYGSAPKTHKPWPGAGGAWERTAAAPGLWLVKIDVMRRGAKDQVWVLCSRLRCPSGRSATYMISFNAAADLNFFFFYKCVNMHAWCKSIMLNVNLWHARFVHFSEFAAYKTASKEINLKSLTTPTPVQIPS